MKNDYLTVALVVSWQNTALVNIGSQVRLDQSLLSNEGFCFHSLYSASHKIPDPPTIPSETPTIDIYFNTDSDSAYQHILYTVTHLQHIHISSISTYIHIQLPNEQ